MDNNIEKNELKINIVPVGNRNTGSSRIRVYNLLEQLYKYFDDVTIGTNLKEADIIIFQKIIDNKLLARAKSYNKFLCYDIDDYFPQHRNMIKKVDLVITSTEYLKEKIQKYNNNIIISENCLDIDNYDIELKNTNNHPPKFAWYGWSTNSKILDKLGIRDEISVISDNGDIEYNINTIDEELKNFDYIIIPQEKTEHNLCKTHCRFLKALYLGIPAIISDMPEYIQLANLINYPKEYIITDLNNFKSTIQKIKDNELQLPKPDFQQIRKIILEHYSNEIIAKNLAKQIITKYQEYQKQKNVNKKSLIINHFINLIKKFRETTK